MSRLTRDRTAESVSRDQILRRERGQGKVHFSCSADHEQDCWQPYPVDIFSPISDDHTYIRTYSSPEWSIIDNMFLRILVSSTLMNNQNFYTDCRSGKRFNHGVTNCKSSELASR